MRNIKVIFVLLLFSYALKAQDKPPLYNEIEVYKKADSIKMPSPNGILFVGSSSLRIWKSLETTYASFNAINRGFGGSTLAQAIYYADDIIFPYQPKQVVIYSGENDIADGVSPEITFDRFKTLFDLIRKKLPQAKITFISIKPSISREKFMPQMAYVNQLIFNYLSAKANTSYINVYDKMLNTNGKPMDDIFLKDNLHMNDKGYNIWIKEITPYLTNTK